MSKCFPNPFTDTLVKLVFSVLLYFSFRLIAMNIRRPLAYQYTGYFAERTNISKSISGLGRNRVFSRLSHTMSVSVRLMCMKV